MERQNLNDTSTLAKQYDEASQQISIDLERMLSAFRVSELQHLLGCFNKSKIGKKPELLSRAIDFVHENRTLQVQQKVKELYQKRFPFVQPPTALPVSQNSSVLSPVTYDSHAPSSSNISSMYNNTRSATNQFQMSGINTRTNSTRGITATGFMYNSMSSRSYQQLPPAVSSGYQASFKAAPVTAKSNATQNQHQYESHVRLVKLPFYDVVATLLRPTVLKVTNPHSKYQENYLPFNLSVQQMNDITYPESAALPRFEVQLRFCLNDDAKDQPDDFPGGAEVRINERIVPLPNFIPTNKPGVEPKRPSRPVNVTTFCRFSQPQRMNILWANNLEKSFVVAVYLVRRLTSTILLERLVKKAQLPAEVSRNMILAYWSPDNEIATTNLRVSLACPVSKMRMKVPCRLRQCQHLQCFDAEMFLKMNEKKPTWMCPACDRQTPFEDLIVDEYFSQILNQAPSNIGEVEILENADWKPVREEEDPGSSSSNDTDDDENQTATVIGEKVGKSKSNARRKACRQTPPVRSIDDDSLDSLARLEQHPNGFNGTIKSPDHLSRGLNHNENKRKTTSSHHGGGNQACSTSEILIDLTGDSSDEDNEQQPCSSNRFINNQPTNVKRVRSDSSTVKHTTHLMEPPPLVTLPDSPMSVDSSSSSPLHGGQRRAPKKARHDSDSASHTPPDDPVDAILKQFNDQHPSTVVSSRFRSTTGDADVVLPDFIHNLLTSHTPATASTTMTTTITGCQRNTDISVDPDSDQLISELLRRAYDTATYQQPSVSAHSTSGQFMGSSSRRTLLNTPCLAQNLETKVGGAAASADVGSVPISFDLARAAAAAAASNNFYMNVVRHLTAGASTTINTAGTPTEHGIAPTVSSPSSTPAVNMQFGNWITSSASLPLSSCAVASTSSLPYPYVPFGHDRSTVGTCATTSHHQPALYTPARRWTALPNVKSTITSTVTDARRPDRPTPVTPSVSIAMANLNIPFGMNDERSLSTVGVGRPTQRNEIDWDSPSLRHQYEKFVEMCSMPNINK